VKVVLLPQAEQALDQIFDPLHARIIKRLRLLERFPELGARMLGPFHAYRSTVVGTFRVIYRARSAEVIEVAYIRNCRRAPLA
jgi:plasmid stabilization system protein ParE